MATFSAVTQRHILAALAEYDDRGEANFLGVYGYAPSPRRTLEHDGKSYDARAVLGVAHKHATGRAATMEEFGQHVDTSAILRKCGFETTGPERPAAPASSTAATTSATPQRRRRAATPRTPTSATTASRRRAAADEAPPAICPTCFMALPATGVCDNCG